MKYRKVFFCLALFLSFSVSAKTTKDWNWLLITHGVTGYLLFEGKADVLSNNGKIRVFKFNESKKGIDPFEVKVKEISLKTVAVDFYPPNTEKFLVTMKLSKRLITVNKNESIEQIVGFEKNSGYYLYLYQSIR